MDRAVAALALSVTAVIKLREGVAHIIAQYNEAPPIFGESNVARDALTRRWWLGEFRRWPGEGPEYHAFLACDSAGREDSRPTPSHHCWNYRESNVANRVGAVQGNSVRSKEVAGLKSSTLPA